jgi:hypothetical protein
MGEEAKMCEGCGDMHETLTPTERGALCAECVAEIRADHTY